MYQVDRDGLVMSFLGCKLDYIWNELDTKMTGHICEGFFFPLLKSFEVGRLIFNTDLLMGEDHL